MADGEELITIGARIPAALARRLDRAATGPLAPTKTQIIISALTAELARLAADNARDKK